jgi:hypothetical protein
MLKSRLCVILAISVLSFSSFAEDKPIENTGASYAAGDEGKYQKIIDDFKAYLAKVKPAIREEVKDFRTEIAKLNKQKQDLYKALSQEAQGYLADEKRFKKQLPRARHNLIGDAAAK